MGMFDTFNVDDCDGQVKTYNRVMARFSIGDRVPSVTGLPDNHSIKLRNGGWVNIIGWVYTSYTDEPEIRSATYDKWGQEIDWRYEEQ